MKKEDIHPHPGYFERYIKLAPELSLMETIAYSQKELENLPMQKLNAIGKTTYSPGKWTINEIFQHILDVERVFNFRALVFSRNDKSNIPGFSDEDYVKESKANQHALESIIDQLLAVRQSSCLLYKSFDEEMLRRTGTSSDLIMSVGTFGFTMVGHQMHHLKIIEERYYPLLESMS